MLGSAEYNVSYSNVEGGYDGEGNFDQDPQFCNPAVGNYELAESSPCVGAGDDGADIGALGVGCAEPYMNYSLNFNGDDWIKTNLIRNPSLPFSIQSWYKFEGEILDDFTAIIGGAINDPPYAGQSSNFFIGKGNGNSNISVSYTHLTLPTICSV